ncbi:hypothetical protein [Xenorhabdus griffiniae]|uniref:hypothetical protein n=1 Tax=Xenorhabdus griffiniae TaxID=351672 RepID=UPI002359856B|nr:hypothetical protein [Xenorhabdus griffiniae]MDC9606831.1 hypothetical protein [Xenorhabdus griffiniae]
MKPRGFTYDIGKLSDAFVYSDLFIFVSDGDKYNYGFVGEIEGNDGQKLFRGNYLGNITKSRYSSFYIGASDRRKGGHKDKITITRELNKYILHFSESLSIIKDFNSVISILEMFFDGHYENALKLINDVAHKEIIELISKKWNSLINQWNYLLESQIKYAGNDGIYVQDCDSESGRIIYKPYLGACKDKYVLRKK